MPTLIGNAGAAWVRRLLILGLWFLVVATGCASSGLSPAAVAPEWAARTLRTSPDAVLSLDVAAMRKDPFFGPLSARMLDDDRGGELSALRTATRIDLFATAQRTQKTWTAVIHGVRDPPAELLARRWPRGGVRVGAAVVYEPTGRGSDGVWLSVRPGSWVLSSTRPEDGVPDPVDMDGHAVFEAWLGPNAIAEGRASARPEAREMLRYIRAARLTVDGGDAPGIAFDARFVSPADAQHAEYDAMTAQRQLEQAADGSEFVKQVLALIGQVEVARHGEDLRVSVHATRAFSRYVLATIEARSHSRPMASTAIAP
jgi:hypothetical protein